MDNNFWGATHKFPCRALSLSICTDIRGHRNSAALTAAISYTLGDTYCLESLLPLFTRSVPFRLPSIISIFQKKRMFEYDRDLSVRHAPFTTWECVGPLFFAHTVYFQLWDSGPQSLPVSDQESICESEDLNVNSNWDFPPLGYHPKPPNQTPNPWRRDVKSYSEAITGTATSKVQPREQLELLEMEVLFFSFSSIVQRV